MRGTRSANDPTFSTCSAQVEGLSHYLITKLPACPFGRRTARHSQEEPQGTGQLTQTERRTQTLKKKTKRQHQYSDVSCKTFIILFL